MFEFLFGWRKASKCKKLIRRVQRRLKLLKNKRSTIARQLRDDLAVLLKHGHGRTAFDRAEQLYKDECLLATYDLLDKFCEFIISNLHYIRRNKDCPNDINEAVSSLIFASARFGDLPELLSIRKLFADRYGQRFAMVALQLLPGNLVNRQMQEKICVKSVSEDEKSRLVEEILRSSLQSGPLLLEYSSEWQQNLENKWIGDQILGTEATNEPDDGDNLQVSNIKEEETTLVHVDFLLENENLSSLCHSSLTTNSIFPSTHSIIVQQTPPDTVASTVQKKRNQGLLTSDQKISPCAIDVSDLQQLERSLVVYDPAPKRGQESAVAESSSESLRELPEEMIYLDDIQELESPLSKERSLQDQRLFKFRSSVVPIRGKIHKSKDGIFDKGLEDFQDQKLASKSIRKNRNAFSKRLRRRSVSGDAASLNDIECAIYYGKSSDSSPNYDQKCHDGQRHHKKISIKQQPKTYYVQEIPNDSSFIKVKGSLLCTRPTDYQTRTSSNNRTVHACSLEHPCYTCTNDEKHDWDYTHHKPTIQLELPQCCCSCSKNRQRAALLNQKAKNYDEVTSPTLLVSTCSGSSSSSASIDEKPSYIRAMTMPLEKPKGATSDSMLRSNSFPLQEHESSLKRHVHPNLPDYDELAAKFVALKKATLQCEKHQPAQMSKKHSLAVGIRDVYNR